MEFLLLPLQSKLTEFHGIQCNHGCVQQIHHPFNQYTPMHHNIINVDAIFAIVVA